MFFKIVNYSINTKYMPKIGLNTFQTIRVYPINKALTRHLELENDLQMW